MPLPSEKKRPAKGGQPGALTAAEERALIEFIRSVQNCAFQVKGDINYACFLRKHRVGVSAAPVSSAWARRFKKRYPEIQAPGGGFQ